MGSGSPGSRNVATATRPSAGPDQPTPDLAPNSAPKGGVPINSPGRKPRETLGLVDKVLTQR